MSNSKLPIEFEGMLKSISNVPEPDAVFINALRAQFISEGVSAAKRRAKSEVIRKRVPLSLKWALVIALILAFLLLATSPFVVTALKQLFGYIPGVGVVEQSTTILVLAEPVTIKRQGITLTVEKVVSTGDKTTVIYRYVGSPSGLDNYATQADHNDLPSPDFSTYLTPQASVDDRPSLWLADGSKLNVIAGRHQPLDGEGILYALDFPSLSSGVTEIRLKLTRLAGMLPGEGPENWDIPLRLEIGDPTQVIYPVFENEPTPTQAVPSPSPGQSTTPLGASIILERTVELPDGYIVMGSFQWMDPSVSPSSITLGVPVIKDASGQEVDFDFVEPVVYPGSDDHLHNWAYKIPTTNFVAPLSFEFYVQLRESSNATFQFDPGLNPQNGQTWNLNIDVPVNGHVVKIISARYTDSAFNGGAFEFTMNSDQYVIGAGVVNQSYSPMRGGVESTSFPRTNLPFTSAFSVESNSAVGPMTIVIYALDILIPGDWVVTWNPPASVQQSSSILPSLQPGSACLTKESWRQALQKNEPLPGGLKGKLSLSMDDLVMNLDGSNRKAMNLGYASSSLSPDGTRIVHSITNGEGLSNGLFITDLISEITTPLPGTASGDSNPLWSQDGTRIAFTRGMDTGILGNPGPHNIVVTNVDGSDFRQITSGNEANRAMAWMPDGINLLYTLEQPNGASVRMIDTQTGEIQKLFQTNYPLSAVKVSPDGKRVAYEDVLSPDDNYLIIVSNLDGSDRKLLADGDPVIATSPVWSPDGAWVIVSVHTQLPGGLPPPILALIQVDTCKVIPLPDFSGYVGSWLP